MRKIIATVITMLLIISIPIAAYAASNIYTDTTTGVTFTIPDGWSQEPLSKEREIIKAKFVDESGLNTILFGSYDAWGNMSQSERSGYTRSDIDNSVFTKSDLAEMLGISSSEISIVTYAGKEYYKFTVTSAATYWITICYFYRVDNGYIYLFQTTVDENSSDFNDVEVLLRSVKYPGSSSGKTSSTSTQTSGSSSNVSNTSTLSGNSLISSAIVSLLLTVLIHPVPILIYRHLIKKEPVAPKKAKKIAIIDAIVVLVVWSLLMSGSSSGVSYGAIVMWAFVSYHILCKGYVPETTGVNIADEPASNMPVTNTLPAMNNAPAAKQNDSVPTAAASNDVNPVAASAESNNTDIIYCRICGKAIPADSAFCSFCGTKVIRK